MGSRQPLAAVLLLCAVAVTGCTDGSPAAKGDGTSSGSGSASPSSTASSTASGSPSQSASVPPTSPSPSPTSPSTLAHGQPTSLPHDRVAAAAFHVAVLNRNAASTPEEHAVVDAWMKFWQAAADSYYYARPTASLSRTSTGAAQQAIVGYLHQKKAQNQRVVGWARDNILGVTVDGDRATVHDCTENFTFSIDADGDPLTRPTPWYDVTGTLQKTNGTWMVVAQKSLNRQKSCLP